MLSGLSKQGLIFCELMYLYVLCMAIKLASFVISHTMISADIKLDLCGKMIALFSIACVTDPVEKHEHNARV